MGLAKAASVPDEETPEEVSSSSTTEIGDSAPPPPPSIAKMLCLAKQEWPMLAVAVVLMIGAEIAGLLNPIILAEAYNALVDPTLTRSERMSEINRTMMIVLIVHGCSVLAGLVRGSIMSTAGERVVARLRTTLYSSILKQEIAFFDDNETGALVSRLGSDTTLIQQATSLAVPEVMLGVVKLCACLGLMFWISAKLAGVTIAAVFAIFIVCMPMGAVLGRLSKTYQDVLSEAQTRSTEAFGAMRTVQSFAAEDRERARFQEKIGDPAVYTYWFPTDHRTHVTTYSVGFFKAITQTGFYTWIFGLGFGSMYFSLWYAFKLVNDDELSLGDITAFQSYIFTIGGGLAQTSNYLSQVISARGASGRVFQLLERKPAIPSNGDVDEEEEDEKSGAAPVCPSSMDGSIEMKNVSFAYPSRPSIPVLVDFSLSVPPGSSVALCGHSGSGKSTVVSLIQRFYDINSGSIRIDGYDIRKLDLKWLRSHIGVVQQEPQLFGVTVRENICYGIDRKVSQEEMERVAKEANAHDFIVKWPMGYDTLVGERGVKMSGGQKQRISIARALLVNPRILLLDEATSALDAESEHLVQEAIDKAVVGRTVLIVAHRLSTIQNAQQIVVLDEHRIVDIGAHGVLMERCSKYQELIKRQSLVQRTGVVEPANLM